MAILNFISLGSFLLNSMISDKSSRKQKIINNSDNLQYSYKRFTCEDHRVSKLLKQPKKRVTKCNPISYLSYIILNLSETETDGIVESKENFSYLLRSQCISRSMPLIFSRNETSINRQ